ncbi:flagellin [Natronomonas sp. F2-12]|jgi:flagellar protein FlaG|uniref:Flagellin n=1 Tax=Natronomonas aquatica TaxID=2841590 RepID=A0A9R1CRG7_9EURY|nr:flagellin [Natronomonas aquatica]MCQ4332376.1 flagellin [Natronomonas aquatica]
MSGVSASHLVIFIASIVVAAGVAGTLVTQVDRVSQSITEQSEGIEEQIDADVQIISDTGNSGSIYDSESGSLTLYVKNTGDSELDPTPDDVDVLVEGRFKSPANVTRVDGGNGAIWPPGSVVEITVEGVDIDGPTRVTVTVEGNEDTIQFRA